jgi:hypothetical protein
LFSVPPCVQFAWTLFPYPTLCRSRGTLADLLGLGADDAGGDAAGLVLALFNGLLFHALLDPALAIEGDRMVGAQARLRRVLPQG